MAYTDMTAIDLSMKLRSRIHDGGKKTKEQNSQTTNRISSQSAPSPLRSRWSKRAGLHVVHCGTPGRHTTSLQPKSDDPTRHPHRRQVAKNDIKRLEQTDGLAHGRLDVQRLDVLPVLLEQRNEEVDAYARG